MIMSERDVYCASHVTPEVKDALRIAARRENKSMSAWVFEAIQEKLKRDGIEIERPAFSSLDTPLPYNDEAEVIHARTT